MEYTIEIDASRGLVKAAGDKAFVESVIDRYEKLMAAGPVKAPVDQPSASATSGESANTVSGTPTAQGSGNTGGLSAYGNVFDITGDQISIIADPPGSTQAAKAKNLCLLYLFAKMKTGEEIVPNEEVRELCKAHAVYDPTNFASQMKSQKKLVIAAGSKGSPNFTLKLTVPGKKAAEEMAKDLEAAA